MELDYQIKERKLSQATESEFDWQMPGQKLPARKKMLAFTLRKMVRKQNHASMLKIREFSHMVGKEWLELKQKGEESFMSEINEE